MLNVFNVKFVVKRLQQYKNGNVCHFQRDEVRRLRSPINLACIDELINKKYDFGDRTDTTSWINYVVTNENNALWDRQVNSKYQVVWLNIRTTNAFSNGLLVPF